MPPEFILVIIKKSKAGFFLTGKYDMNMIAHYLKRQHPNFGNGSG